ncbi:hypothetical protein ES703_76407 [subsurface metagenome]
MILTKAINTLSAMQENYEGDEYPDEENALKLGIEAMKRICLLREHPKRKLNILLVGETEERTVQREGKDIIGDYSYEEAQK